MAAGGALAPGPYVVSAPGNSGGGGTFFKILEPPPYLVSGYTKLQRARAIFDSIGTPEGRAQALACDALFVQWQDEVQIAAVATAVEADKVIQDLIDATQVRPDPPGKSGGRRLRDGISSKALISVPANGAVGIAEIAMLDQAAQDYWRAQEFGSTHLLGRTIRGFFEEPGQAVPSQADFRTHAIFTPDSGGGTGVIRRPIQARGFLRGGAAQAAAFRLSEFKAIESTVNGEIRAITASTSASLASARSFVRGRGGRFRAP